MSSGLGEVGEGSRAQSKLKFPIEKDNILRAGRAREVGPWIAPQSIDRPRAAPALQSSIAPSDAAWCACALRAPCDLLDLEARSAGGIR